MQHKLRKNMKFKKILHLFVRYFKLRALKKQGLKIADDCRLITMPNFGSEPYLISIGKHVTISSEVLFLTHDGGTWVFREQEPYKNVIKFGKIEISDNCFIGARATIMPGVTIGKNSVVGACSLVTKDIPANSVYAGVPAKYICSTEEYAKKCLLNTPIYNADNLVKNKREELSNLFGIKN